MLEPPSDGLADQPRVDQRPGLFQRINGLAAMIARLPSGDVAELRRLTHDDPGCRAFWKLADRLDLPEQEEFRLEQEQRWAAILPGLAMGVHQPGRRLGQALAAAGLSELRFARLLRAQGSSLLVQVRVITHLLVTKAEHADWSELARLVLAGPDHAERVRRGIARDFYHTTTP